MTKQKIINETKNEAGSARIRAAEKKILKTVSEILGGRAGHFYPPDAEEAVRLLFARGGYGIDAGSYVEAWRDATEVSARARFSADLGTLEEIFPYLARNLRENCLVFMKNELKAVAPAVRPRADEIRDSLRTLVRLNNDIGKSGDDLRKITGVFAKGEFEAKFPGIAAAAHLNDSDKLRVALGLYPRNRRAGAAPNNRNAAKKNKPSNSESEGRQK